jgi:predicted SprT family Zn-dependent metalloprotease
MSPNHYVEWVQIYPIKVDPKLVTLCACGESPCEWIINGRTHNLTKANSTQYACSNCIGEVLLSQRWAIRWATSS